MVVHCWGSTTFFMAMLAGLKGVRSAVASQIATQFRTPLATRLKTGLHLPSFLKDVGIESLTAYVDNHESLLAKVYDEGLKLYPLDLKNRCTSATCHRITFMYAPLYEHANLNEADARRPARNVRRGQHESLLSTLPAWPTPATWWTLTARTFTCLTWTGWPFPSHSFMGRRTNASCRKAPRSP